MNEFKIPDTQIIPLKIYQTWVTKDLPPYMKKCVDKLKNDNPEFEHFLYDDEMCREYIGSNFTSDVLYAYDALVPGAYKADLWRYCILYINGGIYMDIKLQCINDFKLIYLTDKEYFIQDNPEYFQNGVGIFNALLCVLPKNELLFVAINEIVNNVRFSYYGYNHLCPTGPGLLGLLYDRSYSKTINFELFNKYQVIRYKNVDIIIEYNEYRYELESVRKGPHYADKWNEKKIYQNNNSFQLISENIIDRSKTIHLSNTTNDIPLYSSNSCIIQHPTNLNMYILITRYVNYTIDQDGLINNQYNCILNVNSITILDSQFNIAEDERIYNDNYASDKDSYCKGIEDIRIISLKDNIYFNATWFDKKSDRLLIIGSKFDINNPIIPKNIININFNYSNNFEKNWSNFVVNDTLYTVYKWFPLQICKIDFNCFNLKLDKTNNDVPIFFQTMKGSTNGFKYNDEIWFITHYSHDNDTFRKYYNIFLVFDLDMKLLRFSNPFKFENQNVDFCLGLIIEDNRVIISYSTSDNTTKIGIYNKTYIFDYVIFNKYELVIDKIVKDNHEMISKIDISYLLNFEKLPLDLIKDFRLSQFNNSSKNVAVMLESRIFLNTEFILRQFSRFLPDDFAMQIYVTENVYNLYLEISKKLNNNINILRLPQLFSLKSVKDYNNIMLDISFWNLLKQFEKVLIFQSDTMLYRRGVEQFYELDYVGAPWYPTDNISTSVGNGGLSLRSINAIMDCLSNKDKIIIPSYHKMEFWHEQLGDNPEDIFYAYAMNQLGYKVADIDSASLFSIELYNYNEECFGSHKLSEYNPELFSKLLIKSLKKQNIPLKVYQSWNSISSDQFKDNTSGFEFISFTEYDCRRFIKDNFETKVLWAYDKLVPSICKIDLWKYCILYKNGGIFIDSELDIKLNDYKYEEYFIVNEINGKKYIDTKFIVCKKNNKILLNLIDRIVQNVVNNFYGLNINDITRTYYGLENESKEYIYIKSEETKIDEQLNELWINKNIYNNDICQLLPNVIIYILCYSEETYRIANSIYSKYLWTKPIMIKYQDYTFENAFWKQLLEIKEEWINYEMVGTLSWKAYQKIDLNNVNKIIMNKEYNGKDYIHFYNVNTLVLESDTWHIHINFKEIWLYILDKLSIPDFTVSYCNYWMCTPCKMYKFINWFLNICLPLLLEHPLILSESSHNSELNKEALIKLWNKPYYPHLPFILERLNKAYFIYDLEKEKTKNNKILLIIACHTNSNLKINALLSNLEYFNELSDNIIIVNSKEFMSSNLENRIKKRYNKCNIIFDYFENDKYLCHGKWIYYLNKTDYSIYENIILANDSFLITRSLHDYKELINLDTELVAILDSYEEEYHYPDFIRAYNQNGIKKVLDFYNENKNKIYDYWSVVINYEIKSSILFNDVKILYKNTNKHLVNIHFIDDLTEEYLYKLNYPIIKLKKIQNNNIPEYLKKYLSNIRFKY